MPQPVPGTVRTRPKPKSATRSAQREAEWTFLTNHAHVLLWVARNPEARMRDVADVVGITERAVQRIVTELEDAGYLVRNRAGRRNTYSVNEDLPLRHPIEQHAPVAALLALVRGKE